MVIDTSALVELLLSEPGADDLAHAIADDPRRLVSAATVLEASIVLEARLGEVPGLGSSTSRSTASAHG